MSKLIFKLAVLIIPVIFGVSVSASHFQEYDPKIDEQDRSAFLEWYESVDVTKLKSKFELKWESLTTQQKSEITFSELLTILQPNLRFDPLQFVLGQSRAPERPVVSFETPRRVVVFEDLSLGQAVGHDEIQIISEVPGTGRNKFQLLKGLGSGQPPNLVTPNQRACLSCHQSGSDHFTASPWPDTTFNPRVREKVVNGFKGWIEKNNWSTAKNPFYDKNRPLSKEDLVGDPNRMNEMVSSQAFAIDGNIRRKAGRIQARRVCETLCNPEDIQCKRNLVALAYVQMFSGSSQPAVNSLSRIFERELGSVWKSHLFSQPSSVLPQFNYVLDNVPTGESTLFYTINKDQLIGSLSNPFPDVSFVPQDAEEELKRFVVENFNSPFAAGFSDYNARLESQLGSSGIQSVTIVGPPSTGFAAISRKRPMIRQLTPKWMPHFLGSFFGRVCFNMELNGLDGLNISLDEIVSIVKADPKVEFWAIPDEVFSSQWPIDKNVINEQLRKAIYARASGVLAQFDTCPDYRVSTQGLKLADTIDHLNFSAEVIEEVDVVPLFKQKCAQCHSKSSTEFIGLDLPLDSGLLMAGYKNGLVEQKLSCGEMPIPGSKHDLSVDERALLIKYLRQ